MANDLNRQRGDRPQQRTAGQRVASGVIRGGKSAANKANSSIDKAAVRMARKAEKIVIPFNDNIFPNLSPEEHRLALIESCINTDEIFKDKITDPVEKSSDDIRDYMFYNQLYFLAAAQITQPDQTGSIIPGLVGGLSMIAGAALVSDDFRKNLKEHAQDSLLKYVEPFKDSAPKLWQHLSAQVESHPGSASPESIALKLLRYQRQAADLVESGEYNVKDADDLLAKKTSELRATAENMNVPWADVVRMRNSMAKDMDNLQRDREHSYGTDWQMKAANDLERKSSGLSEKVGNVRDWTEAKDWSAPIDTESVATRLMAYQKQLQESVEQLHAKADGDTVDSKYAHLAGKSEHEYFASAIEEVAELKSYAEKVLHIKWDDVTDLYNKMNQEEYDISNTKMEAAKGYTDKNGEHHSYLDEDALYKYLPDGSENPNFGKPNAFYEQKRKEYYDALRQQEMTGKAMDIEKVPALTKDGRIADYVAADAEIRTHNKRMYYELPVDAASAGRCLKKYQQEAYECVRGLTNESIHEATDSSAAYSLANNLCKNVRAAADILKFNWTDSVKAYRKDVYNTVLKNPSKAAIWKEMVDGDVIANIPKTTTTYVTENGETKKEIKTLDRKKQIEAWDGVMYNSDGSRIKDDVLMQVRNPYTEDEASKALYNLFVDDFKLQLKETSIRDTHEETIEKMVDGNMVTETTIEPKYQRQIDAIDDERKNIEKRRDELLNAFSSDNFSSDLITKIKDKAMTWFENAKDQMDKANGVTPEAKLDESLSPENQEYPALPDNSMEF